VRVKRCDLAAERHNREFHQLNDCLSNTIQMDFIS
jgi:hypothetical protein